MIRLRFELDHSFALLAVGLTLGLLIGLGWRGPADSPSEIHPREERISLSIERLEAEQEDLRDRLEDLRQELGDQQQAAAAHTGRLEALRAELERQRLLAGLTAVEGAGLRIVLDDSDVQVPPGVNPNDYLVHEQDLRDIVNLLWMAGSEAVAINEERLVASSSIYCAGSTVMVNSTRLSPPYVIQAIGNARLQQDHVRNPSYLQSLKDKKRLYGLRFSIQVEADLHLPAYRGGFLVQHARPGE